MIKAKTNKKIITILSAIIGVVFAFITGFTYCASSVELLFTTMPYSTSAYMENQQYHLINDTLTSPIPFGDGAHNFEIGMKYAYNYSFDVRLKYELTWLGTGNTDTDNVILNFANRDNIIYDEQYIFLANSITDKNGKITFITGVDFVNVYDSTYYGQTLKIDITEVKIYKEQSSYNGVPALINDESIINKDLNGDIESFNSVAAEAWLQYKKNYIAKNTATTDDDQPNAHLMVYNYRRNYEHGVPYPGLESAWKKPMKENSQGGFDMFGEAWTGGNRAYAGAGLYVITGSEELKLEVKVSGIWRDSDGNEFGNTTSSKNFISENSIQFNYNNNWVRSSWDENKLWEYRYLNFKIPANTACYIEILDSIEIISAGRVLTNLYDSYRLITNEIAINPNSTKGVVSCVYEETNGSDKFIQYKSIASHSGLQSVTASYSKTDISVVNTSKYNNGLFSSSEEQQSFKTNISFINNTNVSKNVPISYKMYYHISNGFLNLIDNSGNRAEDYINGTTYTYKDAFVDNSADGNTSLLKNLYYSHTVEASKYLVSDLPETITVAPYSSVNIADTFAVSSEIKNGATLGEEGSIKFFDDPNTVYVEYYDVWVYIVPVIDYTKITNVNDYGSSSSVNTTGLALETSISGSTVTISVRNNLNKTISGLNISNLSVNQLTEKYSIAGDTQPFDWAANFWKYYNYENNTFTQLTRALQFESGYFKLSKGYDNLTVTNASYPATLKPGEKCVVGTATLKAVGPTYSYDDQGYVTSVIYNKQTVIVSGNVTTNNKSVTTSSEIEVVNSNKTDVYIINNSANAYFVRFKGTIQGTNKNIYACTDEYNYVMGIIIPGQIFKINRTNTAEITSLEFVSATYKVNGSDYYITKNGGAYKITVDENGNITGNISVALNSTTGTTSTDYLNIILKAGGWHDNAIAQIDEYFNINK